MDDKKLNPPDEADSKDLPQLPGEDDRNATVRTPSYTTRQPAPYPPPAILENEPVGAEKVDTISVLIPGNEKPKVFLQKENIILGRLDETIKFYPDVDLTPNYGVLMGVSRKHAEITLKDGQCFIQDLYSANGTWLNETKLVPGNTYPLHNGDQIRLGQLLLVVYLSSTVGKRMPEAGPLTEDVRNLIVMQITDKSQTARLLEDGMAPSYLSDTIGVYLRAIAALQYTIRKAQDSESPPVMIRRIQVDEEKRHIDIELRNANDVVSFLHGKLPGFVAQEAEKGRIEASQQKEGEVAAKKPTHEELAKAAASFMLQELVFRFLRDERDTYIDRLSKILGPILKSDLHITRVTPLT